MKPLLSIFSALVLLLIACGEPQEPTPPARTFADLDIVTGLNYLDALGQPIGQEESPNENPDSLIVFPNPFTETVSVFQAQQVQRFFLLPADCLQSDRTDIPEQSRELTYTVGEVEALALQTRDMPAGTERVTLEFPELPTGFYRLFCEMEDGTFLWINLYRDTEAGGIGAFPDFSVLCE